MPSIVSRLAVLEESPRNILGLGASTGSADNATVLQAALDAGEPLLVPPEGADFITAPLTLPAGSNLEGLGFESRLKLKAGSTGPLLSLANVNADRVAVSDLLLDGNRDNVASATSHGVLLDNTGMGGTGLPNHRFDNLIITNANADGLKVVGPGESHFSRIYAYANDGIGVNCESSDSIWHQIVSGQSGLQGIRVAGSNSRWSNVKSWFSGRVDSAQGDGVVISVNRVMGAFEAQDNKRHGAVMLNCKNCLVGFVADSNGTASTGVGLRLDGCEESAINLVAYDRLPNQPPLQGVTRTQAYGLAFAGTTQNNTIRAAFGQHLTGAYSGSEANNYLSYTGNGGVSLEAIRFSIVIPGTLQHKGASLGFYNTAPIAKQTLAAAATDAATTQTLANDLRSKLIALGLFA